MVEKYVFQSIREKEAAQPSPALLEIPYSLRSLSISNRTHENVGKSSANILYRKFYKMSTRYLPPFSCFCRPTLSYIIPQCSVTQGIYVMICLSLRSNRQSLSRQQGIILKTTANAVAATFSDIHTLDKKRIFSGRRDFLKAYPNKKENGMACYYLQRAVWQDSGINTLKMKCVIESSYPAASACKPLPRQAAGTLCAMPERAKQKINNFLGTSTLFSMTFCVSTRRVINENKLLMM